MKPFLADRPESVRRNRLMNSPGILRTHPSHCKHLGSVSAKRDSGEYSCQVFKSGINYGLEIFILKSRRT